jgi:diguanylate cyclase (GGDEF)-like protein
MLEMHVRLLPVTNVGAVLCVLMALAILPWTHPLALIPSAIGFAAMGIAVGSVNRTNDVRPIMGAAFLLQACVAASILINDRAYVGDIFLLVTTIVPASGGFPGRVVTVIAVWSGLLMVATALLTDPSALLASPPNLILPLMTLAVVTLLATAIRRASIAHRQAAVIDGLTGALNRNALAAHSAELEQQTQVTGEPVAVVLVDVDQFKLINDVHGHLTGDRVLVELARRLRSLGPSAQAHRLGGDEFALLLPGATAAQAEAVGRRIIGAARSEPLAGIPVTVSVGLATSTARAPFRFDEMFAEADRALYEAKRQAATRYASRRSSGSRRRASEHPSRRLIADSAISSLTSE